MKKVTIKIEDGETTQEFKLEGSSIDIKTSQEPRYVYKKADGLVGLAYIDTALAYTIVVHP